MPEHPEKYRNMRVVYHPLGGSIWLYHDWATVIRAVVAPRRTVGWHLAVTWQQWSRVHLRGHSRSQSQRHQAQMLVGHRDSPRRTEVNMILGRLQRLMHTEVEMV